MATGYTYPVMEGKVADFKVFAMNCARAFGALITMRDDATDAPIPEEFKPSDHHEKSLVDANADLEKLMSMSGEDVIAATNKYNEEQAAYYRKSVAENAEYRIRYEAMLAKVKAWKIPTSEHKGLRDFMIQQLSESIEWDCREPEKPEVLDCQKWLDKQISGAKWNIEYHTKEHREDLERTASRNQWLRDLRQSLEAN